MKNERYKTWKNISNADGKAKFQNGPSILNTPILIQRERTDATKLERIPEVLQTPSFGPLVIQPQASLNFG
jgi:hypothetical protein